MGELIGLALFCFMVGGFIGFAIGRVFEGENHRIQDVYYRMKSMGHDD